MFHAIRNTALVTFLVLTLMLVGAIVRGWDATAETLLIREDAISYCVRGTASGEFPLLGFVTCLRLADNLAKIQWHGTQAGLLLPGVEQSFRELEESCKGLEKYMDSDCPLREE